MDSKVKNSIQRQFLGVAVFLTVSAIIENHSVAEPLSKQAVPKLVNTKITSSDSSSVTPQVNSTVPPKKCDKYFSAAKFTSTEPIAIPPSGRAMIVTNSYIGPLVTSNGFTDYKMSLQNPSKKWIPDLETECRVGSLEDKNLDPKRLLYLAAETISFLGHGIEAENPKEPFSDNYRLSSLVDIRARCSTKQNPFSTPSDPPGQYLSYFKLSDLRWYGFEGPFQGSDGPVWTVVYERYGIVFFHVLISGRPHWLVEPRFSWLVQDRPNRNIWHKVSGSVMCQNHKPLISYSVTSSKFPSLRSWIETENSLPPPNLDIDKTILYVRNLHWNLEFSNQQGPFSELFKLEPPPPEDFELKEYMSFIERNPTTGMFEFELKE